MCVEIHAVDGILASDVSEGCLRVSQEFYPENSYGFWLSGAGESAMISKRPASLR